jgi:hypothetical protein
MPQEVQGNQLSTSYEIDDQQIIFKSVHTITRAADHGWGMAFKENLLNTSRYCTSNDHLYFFNAGYYFKKRILQAAISIPDFSSIFRLYFSMKFLVPVLLLVAIHLGAQSIKTDTTFLAEAKKNVVERYTEALRSQSHLINGSRYLGPELPDGRNYSTKEHPFYSPDWEDGTVLYDREWYNASFHYDITTQNLITEYSGDYIQLVPEKIEQFTLGNHRFIKLREANLPQGFYEIAYDGPTPVYIRWQKNVETRFKDIQIIAEFIPKTIFYIKKNNVFYEVKSKGSVLRLLAGRKSEIKTFLRAQNQFFSDNRGFFITEMARVYDNPSALPDKNR